MPNLFRIHARLTCFFEVEGSHEYMAGSRFVAAAQWIPRNIAEPWPRQTRLIESPMRDDAKDVNSREESCM